MKVLLIDNSWSVVRDVKKACEASKFEVTIFEPKSEERGKIFVQLEEFCKKETFNFALLDFELWNHLTGDLLVDILKNASVPFIAFSSKSAHNGLLLKLGAKSSIYKDGLYGSRGFDKAKFIEQLEEIILWN